MEFCCFPRQRRQPPGDGRGQRAGPNEQRHVAIVAPPPRPYDAPRPGAGPAVHGNLGPPRPPLAPAGPAADGGPGAGNHGGGGGAGGTPSKQHCGICGAVGVTKASHVVGHAKAALHNFNVQPPAPKVPVPRPVPPLQPQPPTPPQPPAPRGPGGRTPVHVAIQGDCAFDAYDFAGAGIVRRFAERPCMKTMLTALMRDLGVYKRKAELAKLAEAAGGGAPEDDCYLRRPGLRLTAERLQRREEAMRAAAAAAGKPYTEVSTDVDHRVEVQWLAHALLQTPELHDTVCRMAFSENVETKDGVAHTVYKPKPLSQQKNQVGSQTVESMLMPIYQLHNGSLKSADLFNLQLLDSQINRQKQTPFQALIRAHVCGAARDASPAEHLRKLLVDMDTGPFFQDPEGAQRYADALFRDVRTTCEEYGPKLRDVRAHPAALKCYDALGDTMSQLAEEFENLEPRLDR